VCSKSLVVANRDDNVGTSTAGAVDVEDVKDVLYDMLKNAGDEEINTIAQEKVKQWDTNQDGKVTLADFTEYVIKSIAAEKDPWEFAQE
jgi:hypothetical protein